MPRGAGPAPGSALTASGSSEGITVPLIPLGLKETRELDWSAALRVSVAWGPRGVMEAPGSRVSLDRQGNRPRGKVWPGDAHLPAQGVRTARLWRRAAWAGTAELVLLPGAPRWPQGPHLWL